VAERSVTRRISALVFVLFVALFLTAGVPVGADNEDPGGSGGHPDPGGIDPGSHPLPVWVQVLSGFYVLFVP
jgi:hypothetical protein